jgi:glycosyltransferase involved in cell wall biosynthesis
MVYYRFMSQAQRNIWVRTNEEKRGSSFLWEGFDEAEFALGNPKDRKHYLYVSGNWGRGKGIDMVLALAERNPNDTFLACGSKDLEEELTKFASTHPNFKYELVLPRGTKHKEAFMNAKGLLMFTQLDESFGRVTVEALAKGTPVFGSTKGANPELVKVPEMGFLSNDVEEVNKHLHDAFNYTHIHLEAKRLFHIQQEVKRMLNITLHMLEKKY